jgi:hypothetical protein
MPRATRGLQWRVQRVPTPKGDGNLQNSSQLGLRAATRPHELGISSKRVSAARAEYVPGPCTHRPSQHARRACQRLQNHTVFDGRFVEQAEVVTR